MSDYNANYGYILGLDVGIGSCGAALIDPFRKRIVDFGIRLFDSGENTRKRERFSQQRRRFRGIKRLTRRKSHRKLRLKYYLQIIGLTTPDKIYKYFETYDNNVIRLRYKGLSEQLSPEEIAACLIHICNHRGYRDFYEVNIDDIEDPKEKQEYEEDHAAISHISELMKKGGYRTPAEMICKCTEFDEPNSEYRKFHNKNISSQHYLFTRPMIEAEVELLLDNQSKYYSCLNKEAIEK